MWSYDVYGKTNKKKDKQKSLQDSLCLNFYTFIYSSKHFW